MPSQTYREKANIQPSPRQRRQKLDRSQVYGCCSVDQVLSHRDYRDYWVIIFSKFVRRIKIWDKKLTL